jgi:HAD superfamily hydrolase (TIGR01458 family)
VPTPRVVLFDIDGVLTVSWRPLPGAAETVERLRRAALEVAFLTNTTSLSRRAIAAHLKDAGIPVGDDEVLTPARAAVSYLEQHHPGEPCFLVNSGSLGDDLDALTLVEKDASVVLTGGAGPDVGYDTINRAFQLILDGARLVVMQRNWYWATAEGMQLDMGAFIVGLEQATGAEGQLVGKPAPQFFAAALSQVGADPVEAVMVGDDLDADVLGAQALGISGVLVRTGKFRQPDLDRSRRKPEVVIDSVADLATLLGC